MAWAKRPWYLYWWMKYQQMLFYKDFDIVFGMRQKHKRHKAYLLRLQKVCQECGSDKNLTVDHIFPLSLKGSDSISNKQLLCLGCNGKKGAEPYHVNREKALKMHFAWRNAPPLPLEMGILLLSLWKLSKRKGRYLWRKSTPSTRQEHSLLIHQTHHLKKHPPTDIGGT